MIQFFGNDGLFRSKKNTHTQYYKEGSENLLILIG
jgi:hypothetical protein